MGVSRSEFIQTTAAQLVVARASNGSSLTDMVASGKIWTLAVTVAESLAAELEAKGCVRTLTL
jgi:hypothetical protein